MRRNGLLLAMTFAGTLALATLAGCSREKIDWKSAEAADTVQAYDRFLERHPEGALAVQARMRVAQLLEERDWKKASGADTADAYRQFLAQHESGKWAEEARIRIENFSLDGTANGPAKPVLDAPAVAAAPAPAAAEAASPARAPAVPHGPKEAQLPPAPPTVAAPPKATSVATAAAPARAAAPAAKSTAASPGGSTAAAPAQASSFGVQLGAFHSQDAALKNWKVLQTRYDADLHGLFAHAVPVKQSGGQLYRLQAPVGEESRARAICASLAKKSQPCVVVLPQP